MVILGMLTPIDGDTHHTFFCEALLYLPCRSRLSGQVRFSALEYVSDLVEDFFVSEVFSLFFDFFLLLDLLLLRLLLAFSSTVFP